MQLLQYASLHEKISPSGPGAILETPPSPHKGGGGHENLRNFLILAVGFVVFYLPLDQRSEFQNN